MSYKILFKPSVERDFKNLPAHIRNKIRSEVALLSEDPRPVGAVKLSGSDNLYRIRVGDYRVVYTIEDDFLIVLVVQVGHRKEIYRGADKNPTRHSLREFIKKAIQQAD